MPYVKTPKAFALGVLKELGMKTVSRTYRDILPFRYSRCNILDAFLL